VRNRRTRSRRVARPVDRVRLTTSPWRKPIGIRPGPGRQAAKRQPFGSFGRRPSQEAGRTAGAHVELEVWVSTRHSTQLTSAIPPPDTVRSWRSALEELEELMAVRRGVSPWRLCMRRQLSLSYKARENGVDLHRGREVSSDKGPKDEDCAHHAGIRRRAHSVVRPRFRIGCRPTCRTHVTPQE